MIASFEARSGAFRALLTLPEDLAGSCDNAFAY